jgi:RNA polymerase sigma-70 factor (ECF subfamily)
MVSEIQQDLIALVERIIQRDESALTELYALYGQGVYNMAMRVLNNEAAAEEVTQDIFFQVWQQPESWDPAKGRLQSWLLMAARYRAIDRLRREQRRPSMNAIALDDLAQILGSSDSVGDARRDNVELLRSLLAALPKDQREAISLAYFRGMTQAEIAEKLGLPLGTVKGRVRLGLEKLKEGWIAAQE